MTAAPSPPLETAPPPHTEPHRWLRNPFVIALLLSIGLHGVILALLPFFSDPTPSRPQREPVSARPLTAEEFARLPANLQNSAGQAPLSPGLTTQPFAGLPDLSALPDPLVLPPPPNALALPEFSLPPLPPLPEPSPEPLPQSENPPPPIDETPPPPSATATTPSEQPAAQPPEAAAIDESLFAFNAEGTDASLGFGNLGDYVASLQGDYPDLKIPNQAVEVKLPLPAGDRCFEKVQPAQFAVLVGANGKALATPQQLVSSGYPILNQQAIAALEKQPYPLSQRTQLRLINLTFVPPEDSSCAPPSEATG